ncbi:cathelicidin antimicrobial peptide isoform 2-T4 [Thomomys bottae]
MICYQEPSRVKEENPESPKPVRFTMKETVCSKASQHSLEQCDFKQNGLVMQCVGTVTLDQDSDLNIDCNLLPQHSHKIASLDEFLKKGEKKIGEKLENLGQKIKNLFEKFVSKTDLRGSTQPCFWDSEK